MPPRGAVSKNNNNNNNNLKQRIKLLLNILKLFVNKILQLIKWYNIFYFSSPTVRQVDYPFVSPLQILLLYVVFGEVEK